MFDLSFALMSNVTIFERKSRTSMNEQRRRGIDVAKHAAHVAACKAEAPHRHGPGR